MFRLEALTAFHQEAPQQVVQVESDTEMKSLREFRCEPLLDRRPMDIEFLRELAQLRARSSQSQHHPLIQRLQRDRRVHSLQILDWQQPSDLPEHS